VVADLGGLRLPCKQLPPTPLPHMVLAVEDPAGCRKFLNVGMDREDVHQWTHPQHTSFCNQPSTRSLCMDDRAFTKLKLTP